MICPKCGNDMGTSMYCNNCNTYPFKEKEPFQWKKTFKIMGITVGCILAFTMIVVGITELSERRSYNEETTSQYNEPNKESQTDEAVENYTYPDEQNEQKDDDNFGVTVDEVVKTYNRVVIERNPDASQGDINSCSLKDYSLENTQSDDGRKIFIYTYYFEGSKKYMGVNIIEDSDSHKVIYVDLFSHNNFFVDEKGLKIFRELYYCLTTAVDNSIGTSEFNEIMEEMTQDRDFSTFYNGKKFFGVSQEEATYLGIMVPR